MKGRQVFGGKSGVQKAGVLRPRPGKLFLVEEHDNHAVAAQSQFMGTP